MENRKFISFTYTDREKFEKASKELKISSFIELHTKRGIQYGKITKTDIERISVEFNQITKHFLWDSIDSITVVFRGVD